MTVMTYIFGEEIRAYRLFFSALSNETRLAIIALLRRDGGKTVSEIVEELDFEQSRVSHGLKCLAFCGFVRHRREGRSRIYYLNEETLEPLLEIADRHLQLYADHLYKCEALKR